MRGLTLEFMAGDYAVCRLRAGEPVPAWADRRGFSSVTRTADELSIVCESRQVPAEVSREAGWCLIKLVGPFDFAAVGILASVATPLAAAGISLLTIGTFDTDYVLIKVDRRPDAVRVLTAAGHTVREAQPESCGCAAS